MIKHVVLFQLKNEVEAAVRQQAMEEFRSGILALPAVIPCIRHIEVGFNVNPDEKFDIALYGEFDSLDDVRFYAQHPAHVAVAGRIKPYVERRSCTDYEL